MSRPAVSVVMPFAGDAAAAAAAVASLRSLVVVDGDELILSDNSGVAGAVEGVVVVDAAGERSPAHARNVGAARAGGEWILFLDADCVPAPGLLDAYFAASDRSRCGRACRGGRTRRRGAHARRAVRHRAELPRPAGAPDASLPSARRRRQPARPPRRVRAARWLRRGRPRRRGHRLQLAAAGGGLAARTPVGARRAPLPHDRLRAPPAVAGLCGRTGVARDAVSRVQASAGARASAARARPPQWGRLAARDHRPATGSCSRRSTSCSRSMSSSAYECRTGHDPSESTRRRSRRRTITRFVRRSREQGRRSSS